MKIRVPHLLRAAIFGSALSMAPSANAATKTWDGSSSGNWATGANWSGGTTPVPGDDLVFPLGVTRTNMTNNFSPNRAFNSVTFLGANYTINGSTLVVTNGIRSGTTGGDNLHRVPSTIIADVQLGDSQTFVVSGFFSKLVILGNIALGSRTLTIDGNGEHDYSGVISGTGGIENRSFTTLSGDNTFSGPVNIREVLLVADGISGNTPLGSTNGITTVFSGGTFETHGDFNNETLVLSGGRWFNNCAGCTWHGPINVVSNSNIDSFELTIEGILSGNGDLSLTVDSALAPPGNTGVTLAGNGNNTLTGTLQLRAGLLVLDKPSSFQAVVGPLTIGDASFADPTNAPTDAIARYAADSQIGIVEMTILKDGMLDLDGHSDFIGGFSLVGGTVTNHGSGILTLNRNISAAYDDQAARIYGNISLGNFIRTFTVTNSTSTTGNELKVYGSISDGGIIKAGDGYMGLLAANTYSGPTTVSAGTLLVQDDFGLGSSSSGTVVNSGATLYVAASSTAEPLTLNGDGDSIEGRAGALSGLLATCSGPITIASDSTINVPSASPFNLTLSGQISGSGGITKIGPGTLIFSGATGNTYMGNTTVNEGVLELDKTAGVAAINNGQLMIGDGIGGINADVVRYAANDQVLLAVDIIVNDTGLLDLNNFNDLVGDIALIGGTIDTGTGTLSMNANLTATSTALTDADIVGNLNLGASTRTFIVTNGNQPQDLQIHAAVRGSGGIIKDGPGRMSLVRSNSYSGLTTVNDGVLRIFDDFALGTTAGGTVLNGDSILELSGPLNVGSEALTLNSTGQSSGNSFNNLSGTNSWAGDITLQVKTRVGVATNTTLNLAGAIGGGATLTKIDTGTLIFSGSAANTYTNTTTIDAGTLVLNKSGANGAVQGPLVIGDGIGGPNADVVRLASGTQINNNAPVTIELSGLLDLDSNGEAVGSIAGSGNLSLGSGFLNVGFDNTSTTFSGVISGNGGNLTKSSGTIGTLTLSGPNTYAGTTAVNGGTLMVNGSQPQSPVTVGASGTLVGSGTVGNITNTLGGIVAPGSSPGILTSSNVTFTGISSDFTVELNGPAPGTDYDQLNVRGTVSLGGSTLSVSVGSGFAPSEGQIFTIVNNDGSEAITGTFAGLAQGDIVSAGALKFRISYTNGTGNNDVTLTFTNPPLKGVSAVVRGGNGNNVIGPNECNHLSLVITNTSGVPVTNVSATLSSSTVRLIVTQPTSNYPDIPAGGTGTNITPFQISTLPTLVCGSNINLSLTVSSSVGSFVSTFALPTDCMDGGGLCDTCPGTFAGSITNTDLVRVRGLVLDEGVGFCDSPKPCPGASSSFTNLHYDLYRFTNNSPSAKCVEISLNATCGPGGAVVPAAYLNSFDPVNPCSNYVTDIGSGIAGGMTRTCSLSVPASNVFIVVVSEVPSGIGCTNYILVVTGLPCPPPVLNVTRTATSTNQIALDWTTAAAGYLLESTNALPVSAQAPWQGVTNQPVVVNSRFVVTNSATAGNQFYRLRKPL